jgi:hypothetical protein
MIMKETFEAGILRILARLGAINPEDALTLEQAYHESDIDQFDDFLLSEGIVDEEKMLEALSEYFQVPSFDVTGYFFEYHYLHMFPKDMLLRNEIIPLEVDENMMIMIASTPDDPDLLLEIGEYVSYDIRFFVGLGSEIIDAVEEFYDKADTQDAEDEDRDEDVHQEHLLFGEFELMGELDHGDEGILITNPEEERE